MQDMGWWVVVFAAFALAAGPSCVAGAEARPEVLATLRAGHPRLFVTRESLERLRRGGTTDFGPSRLCNSATRQGPSDREVLGVRIREIVHRTTFRVGVAEP